ncbi:MAG: TonB-dependent receptor [Sphingomonadaceae bacterium]
MANKIAVFRLLVTASTLVCGGTLAAQGVESPAAPFRSGVGDIIVTAQKRQESLQDVPISVTALSGDQLAQRQIRIAEDLVSSVPNLQVNSPLGNGIPVFSLRGVTMSDLGLSQNGPIAVYYDEVYKGNFAIMGLGLFDLERVEVLKGPQGTLYGKNTTGGAINLISRKPGFTTGGYLSAGYGNFNRVTSDGAIEVAADETLGVRIAYTFERADGTIRNLYPDAPDASSTRQYGIRGSLRYRPNEDFDLTIRASTTLQNPYNYGVIAVENENGIGGSIRNMFGLPGDTRAGLGKREIRSPDITRRRLRTYALAANADIRINDDLLLTSITSYDQGRIAFDEDSEGMEVELNLVTYRGKTRQFTQDLRLTSDFDGPLNFILGGYYSVEKIKNDTLLRFFHDMDVNGDGSLNAQDCLDGGGLVACSYYNKFNQKKTSVAVYSDATYDITDQITLRGGLRYTHDKGNLSGFLAQMLGPDGSLIANLIPGSPSDLFATTSRDFKINNVSGKAGIDYRPADDVLLYASYSVGYRGSSFNAQAFFAPDELTTVEPEKLRALEAGFKTEMFDHMVRLNGAIFRYSYINQQTLDVDPTTSIQQLVNLPKARILGAELDLQVRPVSRLTLSAGLGLLDTKVIRGTIQGIDIRGNKLISAPKITLSTSADWNAPIGSWGAAGFRVDLSHTSGQYYDLLNNRGAFEDDFTLVNARVRVHPESDRFGVALWVKNLTNTYYRTNRTDVLAGFDYIYTHVNDPRTYGVTVDVKF